MYCCPDTGVSWRCCSRPRIWATGRKIFSPEHDAYRATARRFFKKESEPFVKEWQNDVFFPAEVFKKAGHAGLLCAGIPTAYGGGGGDLRS
jgi:alkylation response protein AidB-like acyl-CoA dehydrogenase